MKDEYVLADEQNSAGWWCLVADGMLALKPRPEQVPNWFHRLMQRWILGFDWVYCPEEKK